MQHVDWQFSVHGNLVYHEVVKLAISSVLLGAGKGSFLLLFNIRFLPEHP